MKSDHAIGKTIGGLLFLILLLCPGFHAFAESGKQWTPLLDPGAPPAEEPTLVISKSDGDDLNLDMITSGFYMTKRKENRQTFQILELGKYHGDLDAGSPNLPTLRKHIYIPAGKTARLQVHLGTPAAFNDVTVYPVQQPRQDTLDAPEPEFYMDESVYASDQTLPSEPVYIEESRSIRGHEIALLHICPFQYNPARGVLEVYPRIKVRIHFDGPEMMMDQRVSSSAFDGFIQGFILNPTARGDYGPVMEEGAEEGAELLIITGPDFVTAADALSDHKATLGITSVVRTTVETGGSKAEIQAYIQDAYDTWAPAPTYVLLLGDVETIPTTYDGDPERGTDLYYSTVDGADFTPDLFLGRISVDTLEQAETVVQKIIDYESNPPAAESFYTNAAIAAYFQDSNADGYADRRFTLTSEEIRDFMLTRGKSVERIYCRTENGVEPTNWNNGIYANGEPIPDELLVSNGFAWGGTGADITAAVNEGVFLLMHRDHGMDRNGGYGRTGWGDPYFTDTHVEALANGALTPVVFSINCQSGWFDGETDHVTTRNYESFSELFLRKAGGGAVGVIGAVRNSYSGYNDALAKGFIDSIWPDFLPSVPNNSGASSRLGHMLNHGKIAMDALLGDPWNLRQLEYELFHLFGDPSLAMWTQKPETQGTHTVRVQSSPVPGAAVTVSLDDVNGHGDGNANFIRTYTHGDSVTLTASAFLDGAGFIKWVVDGADNFNLAIQITMDQYHEAAAVYRTVHTLTMASSPAPGASITVSPDDANGLGDGVTDFVRGYEESEVVTLTAPASHGGRDFIRWLVDGTADPGRTIQVTMDGDHAAAAEYTVLPEDRRILLIDPSYNADSASAIWDAILANGYDVEHRTSIPDVVNPDLYMMVFVCLGVYGYNHELTIEEGDVLKAYLDNGGALYMEGGDTWAFDDPTSVHPYFGIEGIYDGDEDTGTVSGAPGAFTAGLSFLYEGFNNFMDHIGVAAGVTDAQVIWTNQSPRYHNGVARGAGSYKTIGVSFNFVGIPAEQQNDVMKKYIDFGLYNSLSVRSHPAAGAFVTVSPDDVNGAGSDETDFTRIYQGGETATLTAPAFHGGRTFIRWLVDGVENPDPTIRIAMDGCHTAKAEYSIIDEDIKVLVIDLDGNASSALEARDAISANGFNTSYMTSLPGEIFTELHPMVFVFLGIYDINHILSNGEGDVLKAYLDEGGSLYMEGGDTWAYDDPTPVHFYFGIEGLDDGDADTLEVSGVSGSFTEGVSFLYEGDNDYMDLLAAAEGATDAVSIWTNQSPVYTNGVARSTGSYKTIGVSFEFGGVPLGLQNDVMKRYLDFGHYHALFVHSSPEEGIALVASPADAYGAGSGEADFTRYYTEGEEVALTAPADSGGRHFIKWIVDGVENPSPGISLTMDREHEVAAVYSGLHTLSVQSSPITGASIALSPDDVKNEGDGISNFSRTYDDGTVVSLTAPELFDDHRFSHWLVDGVENSSPDISLTMDREHSVTAVYTQMYTLTVQSSPNTGAPIVLSPDDVNDDGDGITNFSRTYDDGTVVSLTAPEIFDDYLFSYWFVDGFEDENLNIQVVMSENHAVEAVFSPSVPDDSTATIGGETFESIQEAYVAASEEPEAEVEIRCTSGSVPGTIVFDREQTVELTGGYSDDFSTTTGATTIEGGIVISNGAVVIENIVIGGP